MSTSIPAGPETVLTSGPASETRSSTVAVTVQMRPARAVTRSSSASNAHPASPTTSADLP